MKQSICILKKNGILSNLSILSIGIVCQEIKSVKWKFWHGYSWGYFWQNVDCNEEIWNWHAEKKNDT